MFCYTHFITNNSYNTVFKTTDFVDFDAADIKRLIADQHLRDIA